MNPIAPSKTVAIDDTNPLPENYGPLQPKENRVKIGDTENPKPGWRESLRTGCPASSTPSTPPCLQRGIRLHLCHRRQQRIEHRWLQGHAPLHPLRENALGRLCRYGPCQLKLTFLFGCSAMFRRAWRAGAGGALAISQSQWFRGTRLASNVTRQLDPKPN